MRKERPTDACSSKILKCGAAQPAGPYDDYRSLLQFYLTCISSQSALTTYMWKTYLTFKPIAIQNLLAAVPTIVGKGQLWLRFDGG